MKKSLKKALIVGSVFAAAMNFNACGYGPPHMADAEQPTVQEETETITTSDEAADTEIAE